VKEYLKKVKSKQSTEKSRAFGVNVEVISINTIYKMPLGVYFLRAK
jgi:hypothetical protein